MLVSWNENAGWPDHFTLSIEARPAASSAIENYCEPFDATVGTLWGAHRGLALAWARILGWNPTPHVLELGFATDCVVIADGYEEPFGDGDDIVHWPAEAFWADPRVSAVQCLWRSPAAPEN